MALSPEQRRNLFKTGRITLGLPKGGLSDATKQKLRQKFNQNGAQGVLGFINRKRVARGILDLIDVEGDPTLKGIRRARSLSEKTAYQGAQQAELPKFDEAGRLNELQQEYQPYFDTQTEGLYKENYGNAIEDTNTDESRLGQDLNSARQYRGYQTQDQLRGQNASFGSRGLDSLSPTAQKLAQRLRDQQALAASDQERGYANTNADILTRRRRLGESGDLFRQQRKQQYQTDVGQQLQNERDNFYSQ